LKSAGSEQVIDIVSVSCRVGPDQVMGGGLFELRPRGPEGIARVMYCTKIGRRIVILHVFIKKTQKTPKRELEIARRRQREVARDE
jgi:phage-related protein